MEAKCINCGTSGFKNITYPLDKSKNYCVQFESIDICSHCGLGVSSPRPAQKDLDILYSSGEYWSRESTTGALFTHGIVQSDHRLSKCLKAAKLQKRDFKILDVGAGEGFLAYSLDKVSRGSSSYHFVEFDKKCVEKILDREYSQVEIKIFEKGNSGYDLIFLNQVLEHVENPINFLKEWGELLNDEGVIYVEVPRLDYEFKSNVFPHTYFFNCDTLSEVSKKASLNVIESRNFGNLLNLKKGAVSKFLVKVYSLGYKIKFHSLSKVADSFLFGYENYSDKSLWSYVIAKK